MPYDPKRDLKEQFEKLLSKYVEKLTNPETIAITRMVTAETLIDPECSTTFAAAISKFQNPIMEFIREAMAAGAKHVGDAQYVSRQLHSLIRGFFYTPQFMLGIDANIRGMMSDCLDMFLAYYAVKKD